MGPYHAHVSGNHGKDTMSEQTQDPTPTQPTATEPEAPNAGASTAAEPIAETPTQAEPFAVFPDAASFEKRLNRDARKQMNKHAKDLGYDDWQHMSDELTAQRQAATPAPEPTPAADAPKQPETAPSGVSEAQRLRMALSVGEEFTLPVALIELLKGETVEAMTAHAQRLVAIVQQSQGRQPGIPAVPQGGKPVTFSRAQLSDAAFVRDHQADILRAAKEGRIVN
jgi:hypothetical protein